MTVHLNIRQYLLRGGAWAFAGKVLTALMGLALSALLARLLSPEDMGVYFLVFNLATFFSIFARMGLENTLLRFISEALTRNQFNRARTVISKGLQLVVLSTIIVAIIVYLGVSPWLAQYLFKSNIPEAVFAFLVIWLILLAFQFLFAEIFRAFHDIRMAVLSGGLLTSVVTVIFITFYMLMKGHAELSQVLPWILLAGILNIAIAIWMMTKKLHVLKFSTRDNSVNYSELANHSWPMLINAVTLFILSQSDIWILAAFRSDDEVAVYGAAARLVLLTGMALSIVNAVVPPLIAHMNVQNKKKQLERILRTAATFAALPSLLVLSVFMFFGSWVLEIIFGGYYRTGGTILMIFSIGQVVNVLVGSCGYTLVMMGYRRTVMLISLFSAAIALGSGLIFVRSYGAVGLACGFVFALIVQQLAMLVFARYRCGIWTHAGIRYLAVPMSISK